LTTKRWIIVFSILAVICAFVLFMPNRNSKSKVVTISSDGHLLNRIDLSAVKEAYTLTVDYHGSTNTIRISPHAIEVIAADCSNQICVDHGPLTDGGAPITCLPNRLIIQWAESRVDG